MHNCLFLYIIYKQTDKHVTCFVRKLMRLLWREEKNVICFPSATVPAVPYLRHPLTSRL